MQKKKNESEALYGELGHAFNFTVGDLEANRAGFISHRQAQALRQKTTSSLMAMQITTAFFLGLTAVFGVAAFTSDMVMLCFAAPFALFALIFIALSVDKYVSMQKDLSQRVIKDVECEVKQTTDANGNPEYRLMSGNLSFKLSSSQLSALKINRPYQVYYAERSAEIIAIEDAQ